nr:uncharacterized protein LOC129383138 [Dermacentor andersoni]
MKTKPTILVALLVLCALTCTDGVNEGDGPQYLLKDAEAMNDEQFESSMAHFPSVYLKEQPRKELVVMERGAPPWQPHAKRPGASPNPYAPPHLVPGKKPKKKKTKKPKRTESTTMPTAV